MNDWNTELMELLDEVARLMAQAYRELGPVPAGHALDQAGLEQGREIVLDYLAHGEAGVAFEHLRYMIDEPPLVLSERGRHLLAQVAAQLQPPL